MTKTTTKKQNVGPSVSLRAVRSAAYAYRRALRAEEEATTYEKACRLAHCTQKALNVLRAVQNGVEAPTTPRVAAARCAFNALATIGRVVARGVQTKNALARAQAANLARRAAKLVRLALRRTLAAVAAALLVATVRPAAVVAVLVIVARLLVQVAAVPARNHATR